MNAEQLKAIQSPLKARYKADPSSALVTLRATGRASADLSCNVETVKGLVAAGPHPAIGGDGKPNHLVFDAVIWNVAFTGCTSNAARPPPNATRNLSASMVRSSRGPVA